MDKGDGDVQGPKSDRGARTLPLPDHLLATCMRNRALRQQEHLKYGAAWDEDAWLLVDGA